MKTISPTQLGRIGLGRMGANMVRRLCQAGHPCVVFDHSPKKVNALTKVKVVGTSSLADFARNPRLRESKQSIRFDEAPSQSRGWVATASGNSRPPGDGNRALGHGGGASQFLATAGDSLKRPPQIWSRGARAAVGDNASRASRLHGQETEMRPHGG